MMPPIEGIKVMAVASVGSSSIFEIRISRTGCFPETKYISTEELQALGIVKRANTKSAKKLERWLNSKEGQVWAVTAKHNPIV
jgi:hypothetical protein